MKPEREERGEAGEREGPLLAVRLALEGAGEAEEEGDPGGGGEGEADEAAGDEELERVAVGPLDESRELGRLDGAEGLEVAAEAGAEDGELLPGRDGEAPDEEAALGVEVARVGRDEAEEGARARRDGDEEERRRERRDGGAVRGDPGPERGPAPVGRVRREEDEEAEQEGRRGEGREEAAS